ncbi:MAG: protein kinase [Archangium sp.]|nr:protein kinase [Archangium sp.]
MTQAFGNYQLVKKLATGGMAEVWLAKQTGIEGFNRHVVVKRILPHLAEDPEFVQMFLNEAKIASRFNHPNIAQIYDLGETNGQYFIAMEFIHGEDLGRVMRRAWSTGQWVARHIALRIVADSCQGLHYAHTRLDERGQPLRVVHRDISPQNILISFDGAVKVVDFGIAKASDQVSNTKSGAIKGKFAYMAPEQAAGKPLDARSDIFALGLVLYELATGVRPLKRDSELATLQAALECKIDAPSAVAEVPHELDDIVMRALAKAPDDRYSDAREMSRAIEQYLLNAKELATTTEVGELMGALFADRLSEEARLGTPNPSTESSTSNPIPPSYSGVAQSVTQPPEQQPQPQRDARKDSRGASRSATPQPVRAAPNLTIDEDADEATLAPDMDESAGDDMDEGSGPSLRGGYDLPAGTVVPSRRYVNKKNEATVAGRSSKEMTRMAPIEETSDDLPPVALKKKSTALSKALATNGASEPVAEESGRRKTGMKRRTSSGVMPEAPPRRNSRVNEPEVKPSKDGISAIVDVKALKERQQSRLKALVSVMVLIGALILVYVFKDNLLGLLKKGGLSEDGVPVRLSVKSNPPVEVFVLPPPGTKVRKQLNLGRTGIDEQSGAFVGDTIRLVNDDLGIYYEEVIEYGQPNELKLISKVFKPSAVRIRVLPNSLKGCTVWRGPRSLGQVGVNLSLYPGKHELTIKCDGLRDACPFTVNFNEGAKNLEWPVDCTEYVDKK